MSAPPKVICGIVVSAGKMMRAVKVRTAKQVYNNFLKKHFLTYQSYLVSDPNSSLRAGDVVRIARSDRQVSRHIRHIVTEIVTPWGPPIEERPRVLTDVEREEIHAEKKRRKNEKKRTRDRGDGEEEVKTSTTDSSHL